MKFSLKQFVKVKSGLYENCIGTIEGSYAEPNTTVTYLVKLYTKTKKCIQYHEHELTSVDTRD